MSLLVDQIPEIFKAFLIISIDSDIITKMG